MFDLTEMEEHAAELAGPDPGPDLDDHLFERVGAIERIRSLLDAAEAHHLAELDRRGACDEQFGLTTTAWLALTSDCSRRTAGGRVKTARRLRHLPMLDQTVSVGELSFEHLQAVAAEAVPRVLPRLAGAEPDIVKLAGAVGFDHWRREVRRLVDLLDDDGREPDEITNRLRFAESLDGVTHLDGTMTVEVAAVVRDAIESTADELARQRARDVEVTDELRVPRRDTLRMLALVVLVRSAVAGGGSGPARPEVHLILHDRETTDRDGRPLPVAAAGVWGCDPDLWAFVVDDMGVPLDVGHVRRFATPAQRRAVAVRDGGCVFPGCDRPVDRCDVHHVVPFPHGGTDLHNLATLCRHHHTVTHRVGWHMRTDGRGSFAWTTPSGRQLTSRMRPVNRAPP
jgi:hypothetical protein